MAPIKYTKAQELQVLELKRACVTNKDICEKTNLSIGQVKRIIAINNAYLTPEQRQKNALQAKLTKDPQALIKFQSFATSDKANKKRSKTMKEKFDMNPSLSRKMGSYSKNFWKDLSQDDLKEYLEKRQMSIEASEKVKQYRDKLINSKKSLNYKSVAVLKDYGVNSADELMQKYADKVGGQYISGYVDIYSKCEWKCASGHTFTMRANNVQQGQWCPRCRHTDPSAGQLEMYEYVKSVLPNEEVILCDRNVLEGKELDIFIPSKMIGIEYDGLYAHCSYHSGKSGSHYKKYELCRSKGIKLLAFFEDEWKNKENIVKSIVSHKLGVYNGKKVRASKCEIVRMDNQQDFAGFFRDNHLDGNSNTAFIAFGLKYQGELVMCLSLRKHFHNKEIEIARMATKIGYQVMGGASRLFKVIPKPIVTFSNNRFSIGDVYRRNGFSLVSENGSNYFYTDMRVRYSRFKHRKIDQSSDIYNQIPEARGMTETEQNEAGITSMFLYGTNKPFYKIEDYGHMKWIRET